MKPRREARRTSPAVMMPPDLAARGACAQPGANPDLWFTPGREKRAAEACGACPVISLCAEWAAAWRPAYGVWAGLTPGQRIEQRRREQRRREAS